MESHYRGLSIDSKRYTGEKWGKLLIKNIWNMILTLWENRNEIVHGKQTQDNQRTKRRRLLQRVHKYFERQDQLGQHDRTRIFYKDEEEIQLEDTRYIKAWLKIAQQTFAIVKREQAKPRTERRVMEQYFAWKPPIDAKERRSRAPRSPAETHPD
jgi:hypothetical protein